MDQTTKQHFEQVRLWLDENVRTYPSPKQVTLSQFQVDWESLCGSFALSLDNEPLPQRLRFTLEESGRTRVQLPTFHSPLGAPASYAAIEFTEKTTRAILNALHDTIPRVKGLGIDRDTGKPIYSGTLVAERIIDMAQFQAAKDRLAAGNYSILRRCP